MKYKAGYKYQLIENEAFNTPIKTGVSVEGDFYRLDGDGFLIIRKGYAWDGPSGPTRDTKNFMRGSLPHDALYQMFGEGKLDPSVWREAADKFLIEICKEDGMSAIRRAWVYAGVRVGGARIARTPDKIHQAP
jgi:hypothetical protein